MDRKIVFFDIDGTIFNPKIGVTDKTKQAIKELHKNNHLAFVSTGRAFSMVKNDFLNLGFDGFNIACGTYIIIDGKLVLNKQLPQNIINETIKLFKKFNIEAVFEGENAAYIDKSIQNRVFKDIEDIFDIEDWTADKIIANKLSARVNNIDDFKIIETHLLKYFDMIRGQNEIELVPKGYNKATGIEFIINYLNIDWENTYAFGDSENDIEMLKYVKHSVAMGNSADKIKQISKYITDSIFDDGVYTGLKKLELI